MPLAVGHAAGPIGVGAFIAIADVDLPSRTARVFEGKDKPGVEACIPVFVADDGHIGRGLRADADFEGEVLVHTELQGRIVGDDDRIPTAFKAQFGGAWGDAVFGSGQDVQGVFEQQCGFYPIATGQEKHGFLFDGGAPVVVPDSSVVRRHQDQPVLVGVIGAA